MSTSVFSPSKVEAMLSRAAEERGVELVKARAVLGLRRRHRLDGNRRRLFAALDDLFSRAELGQDQDFDAAVAPLGQVRLRRLVLRNWKVFEHLDLDLPALDSQRPVVLVGGKNGYGKTSLLEGLLFGLFGRDAVLDLVRLESAARSASYRTTLSRAFNQRAFRRGERVMAVSSEWDTVEGPLAVERKWYLDDAGALIAEDESLTLRVGEENVLLQCPEDGEPGEFYQEEVHRRLMTPSLAAFVFFDGERVERFAEAAFSQQVRSAVESVSGLSVWRRVAFDLRDYAKDRTRSDARSDRNGGPILSREQIERELAAAQSAVAGLMDRRLKPTKRRDELLAEIASLEFGNYQNLHQLLERRQANAAEAIRARHELAAAATNQLPQMLCGPLRAKLSAQLQSEMSLATDDAALFQNDDALEALVAALNEDAEDGGETAAKVRGAWSRLCASRTPFDHHRHPFLPLRLKAALGRRLSAPVDADVLRAAADRLSDLEFEASSLAEAAVARRSRDERLGAARRELSEIRQEISGVDAEARIIEERLTLLRADLETIDAMSRELFVTNPSAGAAIDLAAAIEELVEAVLPECFASVGEAVTEAYLALAHKRLVARVDVSEDGSVVLLDGDGRDVRYFDASAGESHIFAMALMAAVGALTGNRLPVIVDTPLGRLDPDHRMRVLDFFASRPRQTILLSQPDEVNGTYLEAIQHRVCARFRLDHASVDGGLGATTATAGYFEGVAA